MREKAELERAGRTENGPATITASSVATVEDHMNLDAPVAELDKAEVQADLKAQQDEEAIKAAAAATMEAEKEAKEESELLEAQQRLEQEGPKLLPPRRLSKRGSKPGVWHEVTPADEKHYGGAEVVLEQADQGGLLSQVPSAVSFV